MTGQILTEGIYFHQSDIKEDGYYTKDDKDKLIKHKYEEPTFWHKLKHYLNYGYAKNTDTKTTTFFYFDRYHTDNVYLDSDVSDAISMAKRVKKSPYSFSRYKYEKRNNKMIIDLGKTFLELELSEDGRKLITKNFYRDKNECYFTTVFTFLNWQDL